MMGKDEGGGESSFWNALYKVIFIPYAITFLGYIAVILISALLLKILGLSSVSVFYIIIAIALCAVGVVGSWALGRRVINYLHRRRSHNPDICILEQDAELQFFEGNTVAYSVRYRIDPRKSNCQKFSVIIGWGGALDDAIVADSFGCNCTVTKNTDRPGCTVRVDFKHPLPKGVPFTFGYSLLFDDKRHDIGQFLSVKGYYLPERRVTLKIALRQGDQARFRRCKFRHPTQLHPFHSETDDYPSTIGIYEIKKPAQGVSYRLSVE